MIKLLLNIFININFTVGLKYLLKKYKSYKELDDVYYYAFEILNYSIRKDDVDILKIYIDNEYKLDKVYWLSQILILKSNKQLTYMLENNFIDIDDIYYQLLFVYSYKLSDEMLIIFMNYFEIDENKLNNCLKNKIIDLKIKNRSQKINKLLC